MESDEPAARWVTLTGLSDRPPHDPEVRATHEAVLRDPLTQDLISRLPDWEAENPISGHESPRYAPNLLQLLADMGVRAGDSPRVDAIVEQMLLHQDEEGRFAAYGRSGHGTQGKLEKPTWGVLLCDAHAVAEVLVRFGRAEDCRTRRALRQMAEDRVQTPQGIAWPCRPHSANGFRGPGRKADACLMVTLEGLRTFARLPEPERPARLIDSARALTRAWRIRGEELPYMFGHGYRFKTVKWPIFWYGLGWMADTLGRYPGLWSGPSANPEDRQAVAEMIACLVAYNFNAKGVVIPKSCYKGFESFSFGQKKLPSAFATARLATIVRRFEPIAEQIQGINVLALGSSKGGSGVPIPPRG